MNRLYIHKTFLSSLSVALILCSCNTPMNFPSSEVHVKFPNTELESSSVLSKQEFVKLESSNQSAIIGGINRLLCSDSLMFIVDKANNKIASFDYRGQFVASTLSLIGHARNEYVHLLDAAIDLQNKQIYVYCDIPSQVLILDYDLRVKESIKMNDLILEIAVDSEYMYALCPNLTDETKYDIRCYKKDNLVGRPDILIVQDRAIPKVEGWGKVLNKCGEYIFTCLPFDNTIYKICCGKVINSWHVDFGDRWFDYSECKHLRGTGFLSANEEKHWIIQNIVSSKKEMIFNTNQTNTFKISISTNEGTGFLRFRNKFIPFSNSWFIPTSGVYDVAFSIPSSQIVDYRDYYIRRNKTMPDNSINSIIQTVSKEDNPLIVLGNIIK